MNYHTTALEEETLQNLHFATDQIRVRVRDFHIFIFFLDSGKKNHA